MRKLAVLLIIAPVIGMSSCGKKAYTGDNPLLSEWDTPYGMPPFADIKPEHYKPAILHGMELENSDIEAIINNSEEPDFNNTILALDNAGQELTRTNRVFSLTMSANSNDEMRAVRQEVTPLLSAHNDNIYLNSQLFDRVKQVYTNRENSGLDKLQIRLTEKVFDRFKNAGADLDDTKKEELRRINEELSLAQIKFNNNVLGATKDFTLLIDSADVTSLPKSVQDAGAEAAVAAGHKGKFLFTLSKPSMLPFLTHSDRRDLREQLYKGYLERCNGGEFDNKPVVNDIVRLRMQKAQLLGYSNFAQYTLENRMADSPDAVYDLLDQLWAPALETAKAELAEMKTIKESDTGDDSFESWDWWYYAEKVRKKKYALDEEMLKPYFSLQNVQAGIFELCNRLYGLTFRPVTNVPVYHRDCTVYEVFDNDNTHLGVLLMDFFPRGGSKNVGAWCGSYRSRTYDSEGNKTDPIVTIVCNFTPPVAGKPALLSLDETETFFHEFGHALHSLMTDVPYRGLIGTERDFVELPSQIMENWAFEPQMLKRYALHYSSKAVIPDNLIEKINETSHFNQGFILTELLAASLTDMDIHTLTQANDLDLTSFENWALYDKRGLIPQIAPRYKYPYFSHIFSGGYAAGYYSYIWAEVLDKDAYEAFLETGDIFDRRVADSFRANVLEKGGSLPGMEMYRNFRGADPAKEPILYGRGLKERPKVINEDLIQYPEGFEQPDDENDEK